MIKRNNQELRKAIKLSAFFLAATFVAIACKKEEGDLGLQVQPQDDQLNVGVIDTSTIIAYTVYEDSLRSDEFLSNMIGSYVDPVFGKVSTGIHAQIRIAETAPSMVSASGSIAETVVDSVFLYLDLDNYYGELDAQTFEVYRVTEQMDIDSNYYSNHMLSNDGVDLVAAGMGTIIPDPLNPGSIEGEATNPVLKIPLNTSFGDDVVAENGNTSLATADDFVNWWQGLYITVNNPSQAVGEGSILFTDLVDDNSRVSMYYRYTFPGEEDTLELDFNINSSSARYNTAVHDYTGTAIEAQQIDSTLGSDQIYVQALSGCKAKIEIPFLQQLPDSIVVANADLILPYEFFESDPYAPHSLLHLVGIDDDGETFFLDDFFEGETVHGGAQDNGNLEYRFNIAKHVNNVLTGAKSNNGLYILSSSAMITANRAVINGTNSSNRNKMRLEITYTKL